MKCKGETEKSEMKEKERKQKIEGMIKNDGMTEIKKIDEM